MLPKAWRRKEGKVLLYKGGTSGLANTGKEPYSEFYAAQVAEAMGIPHVTYGLSKWKGQLCSTITNVNFNNETILQIKNDIEKEKAAVSTTHFADYDMAELWRAGEDVRSLPN